MPQYQHYVPNFILRQFSTNYVRPQEPKRENYADEQFIVDKKKFEKAKKKENKKAKVNIVNFKDGFAKGRIEESRCNNTFGRPVMYNDDIEAKLSRLENQASEIIYAIDADFIRGAEETKLSETQKSILLKFFITMFYRNRDTSDMFGRDWHDLDLDDREPIYDYMVENGISTPRDVWLKTLEAFIDIDLSQPQDVYSGWLIENGFPDHARGFCEQLCDGTFYICTPNDNKDEFVLTQNVYIFA
ncbi:hypothetical protein ABVK25_012242 [Lepraria finkii]|uniref:DUF4238 domain-containing protein n=1 Tax=Lepraria finkii TaxID=1340010 RepID=A0ABR4AHV4_9LECA